MTEAEWLSSNNPKEMLRWGKLPSARKLRLYAIAVAKHGGCGGWANVENVLSGAERMADTCHHNLPDCELEIARGLVATYLVEPDALQVCFKILTHYEYQPPLENATKAGILRDIVGNPHRPVVLPNRKDCVVCAGTGRFHLGTGEDAELIHCRCCPWITTDARTIAQAAYDLRNTDGFLDAQAMRELSDALEEAGCYGVCERCKGERHVKVIDHPPHHEEWIRCDKLGGCDGSGRVIHPLLVHLRSAGPHHRGCWAVDLILGKE